MMPKDYLHLQVVPLFGLYGYYTRHVCNFWSLVDLGLVPKTEQIDRQAGKQC